MKKTLAFALSVTVGEHETEVYVTAIYALIVHPGGARWELESAAAVGKEGGEMDSEHVQAQVDEAAEERIDELPDPLTWQPKQGEQYFNSPAALLAVAFPPQRGMPGACVRLMHLQLWQPHLMSKHEAARLVFARNMERHAPGNGNRARRRIRLMFGGDMVPRSAFAPSSPHSLPIAEKQF